MRYIKLLPILGNVLISVYASKIRALVINRRIQGP